MPKIDGGGMRQLFDDGTIGKEAFRTPYIPSESSFMPLMSPDRTETALRMHELIVPVPDNLIVALGGTAL
jgi:hypothetical protein